MTELELPPDGPTDGSTLARVASFKFDNILVLPPEEYSELVSAPAHELYTELNRIGPATVEEITSKTEFSEEIVEDSIETLTELTLASREDGVITVKDYTILAEPITQT